MCAPGRWMVAETDPVAGRRSESMQQTLQQGSLNHTVPSTSSGAICDFDKTLCFLENDMTCIACVYNQFFCKNDPIVKQY